MSILVMPLEVEFRKQVAAFRQWAAGSRTHLDYGAGEWECEYEDWHVIRSACSALLDAVAPSEWNEDLAEDLLYILARDNEDECIKEDLVSRPACLIAVAKIGLGSGERDARWQIADALGSVQVPDSEVEDLLVHFHNDSDEYVRCRALMAIGERKLSQAEALALCSWETGMEQQQMVALNVLHCIGSAKFDIYRQIAERDSRQYLVKAAKSYGLSNT